MRSAHKQTTHASFDLARGSTRQETSLVTGRGQRMNSNHVRRGVLASSLALALFAPYALAQTSTASSNDQQQNNTTSNPQNGSQKPKTLEKVTVTGSLIPRSEIEGPAPVNIITGEQIKAQGFTTL